MKRLLASLTVAALALGPVMVTQHTATADSPAFRDVCSAIGLPPSAARCFAIQHIVVQPATSSPDFPSGFHPADLQSAYNLPSMTAGSGQTVAIVDAYDDPNAESDLAHYRSQFGLPPCTSTNGCFKKVNQNGQPSPLPKTDPTGGWEVEESLDVDMVSAICPNCKIILVEGNDNTDQNLGIAANTAATMLGANAVSNSYGTAGEAPFEQKLDGYYRHRGVAVTASSGDSGYTPTYPASSPFVTAVGGTSLFKASGTTRGWRETAWSGAGSYCSPVEPKPNWQTDPLCSRRTYADVSAVADPSTGVAMYDTYLQSGWLVVGGTSVASPIIASVYALAGNAASTLYGSYPYGHAPGNLNDVTKGSNGSCGGTYLCTAGPGYDGPTGLGTPNGTGAF